MKTMLCAAFLITSCIAGNSQDAVSVPGPPVCPAPIVYTAAVVYTAPVVYSAPVVYNAPVYYAPPQVTPAAPPACAVDVQGASTVVCIGGPCGTYAYSNYGSCGSTVVTIGSHWARR